MEVQGEHGLNQSSINGCQVSAGSITALIGPQVSTPSHILANLIPSMRNYWAARKKEQRIMAKDALRMRIDGRVDDKERKKICRHMAKCWRKQTQGLLDNLQAKILVQLLQHPTFSNLQQTSLKVERAIFSNIRNTLSEVKIPHSNNKLFLKRATVMACLNVNSCERYKIIERQKCCQGIGCT